MFNATFLNYIQSQVKSTKLKEVNQMDITATKMAEKLKIPYQRMVDILYCTNMYHNIYYGFWDTAEIHYQKRGNRRTKEVDCFRYNLSKVRQKISIDIIACGQVSKRSKKTKRYLIRNYGL